MDWLPPDHRAAKGTAVDDLLSDFLTETNESLAELDVALVTLERTPNDAETLGFIFRMVHTIKGTCGFLGLPRLERVAHAGENVLGKLRDHTLTVTPDIVTQVLAAIDAIKVIVTTLSQTGAEPPGNDADLIAELNATAANEASKPAAPPVATPCPRPSPHQPPSRRPLLSSPLALKLPPNRRLTSPSRPAPRPRALTPQLPPVHLPARRQSAWPSMCWRT
jgi:two-component system, chemotaxis family, sensor kinase CheA